jgi:hypothetical protein
LLPQGPKTGAERGVVGAFPADPPPPRSADVVDVHLLKLQWGSGPVLPGVFARRSQGGGELDGYLRHRLHAAGVPRRLVLCTFTGEATAVGLEMPCSVAAARGRC